MFARNLPNVVTSNVNTWMHRRSIAASGWVRQGPIKTYTIIVHTLILIRLWNNRFRFINPKIGRWMVIDNIRQIFADHNGLLRSFFRFIFGNILWSIWKVQIYTHRCVHYSCFWTAIMFLYDIPFFSGGSFLLRYRHRYSPAPYGHLHHINGTRKS